jgi:hypothetical protein
VLPRSVLPTFRHHQFPFIILVTVHLFNSNLTYECNIRKYRSSSNLVMVRVFWTELHPLIKSLITVHYKCISNGITHLSQIWHMDTSKKCPGQSWILLWFEWFLTELCPFHFKNNEQFSISFIISPMVLHIQLKYDIWIRQRNAQVKVEFGHCFLLLAELCPFYFVKK